MFTNLGLESESIGSYLEKIAMVDVPFKLLADQMEIS
jgi:hypothetical protein